MKMKTTKQPHEDKTVKRVSKKMKKIESYEMIQNWVFFYIVRTAAQVK
jgi:hypothetical protein